MATSQRRGGRTRSWLAALTAVAALPACGGAAKVNDGRDAAPAADTAHADADDGRPADAGAPAPDHPLPPLEPIAKADGGVRALPALPAATSSACAWMSVATGQHLSYTPDGRSLVTDGWGLRVYDVVTGAIVWNERTTAEAYVPQFSVSADGARVAFSSHLGWIDVRRMSDGMLVRRIDTVMPDNAGAVALSPDGATLALAEDGGVVSLWNVTTGARQSSFTPHGGSEVFGLAYSPGGSLLATSDGMNVRSWNSTTLAALMASPGDGSNPMGGSPLRFSKDGLYLIAAGSTSFVYRVADLTLTAGVEGVNATFVAGTTDILTLGEGSGLIRFTMVSQDRYDLSGSPVPTTPADVMALAPDGQGVALGSTTMSGTLSAQSTPSAAPTWTFDPGRGVAGIAIGATSIVVVDGLGVTRFWSADGKTLQRKVSSALPHVARGMMALSPAEDRVALIDDASAVMAIWDLTNNRKLAQVLAPHDSYYVRSIAFSDDGTRVLTGGLDQRVRVWNAADGTPLANLAAPDGADPVVFGPGDRTYVTAGTALDVFDAATGAITRRLDFGVGDWSFATTPDHGMVAYSPGDGRVRLFNLNDWILLADFTAGVGDVQVKFTADGAGMVTTGGSDNTLRAWRTADVTATAAIPIGYTEELVGLARAGGRDIAVTRTHPDVADFWCLPAR